MVETQDILASANQLLCVITSVCRL